MTRKLTPFDFVTDISFNKKDLISNAADSTATEKSYSAYIVNRSLSYFPDTVMYSNEMNTLHGLDNKLQYDYLINIIRPRKRFAKWHKKQDDSDFEAVKEYYKFNNEKCSTALSLLSAEQIAHIKMSLEKGG